MTQEYYSIITNAGLIKNAAANSGGSPVNLTHLAVGDSNGSYYNPTGTAVALQNEKHRTTVTHVVIDEDNPNQLIVEAVINEIVGPFYIREVGVFDEDGDLFAIGKYPETFKPDLPAGSGKRLYIRMILGFASSPNVELIISDDINNDPNFSTDVNNALAERLVKAENLADLENVSEARDNLGVYSKSYLNSKIGRNYIMNGNFDIWQRDSSFNISGTTVYYTADRWNCVTQIGGAATISRQAFAAGQTDVPNEPTYFLRFDQTSSGIGYNPILEQRIEDVRSLAGKKCTISFYAKALAALNLDIDFVQVFGSGGSVSVGVVAQTINLNTSFQKFTLIFDIPSIAGKTVGSSSFLASRIRLPENAAFTVDIAQIQIEEGNIATDFERRHISEILALCQRYWHKRLWYFGWSSTNHQHSIRQFNFPVEMRVAPTITNVVEAVWGAPGVTVFAQTSNKLNLHAAIPIASNGESYGHFMADAEL